MRAIVKTSKHCRTRSYTPLPRNAVGPSSIIAVFCTKEKANSPTRKELDKASLAILLNRFLLPSHSSTKMP